MDNRKLLITSVVVTVVFLLGAQLVPSNVLSGDMSLSPSNESMETVGDTPQLVQPNQPLREQDSELVDSSILSDESNEAIVLTDLATYLINETVEITGAMFPPDTAIIVNVSRPCCCGQHPYHWEILPDVYSDNNGEFVAFYNLTQALGIYDITATGDAQVANNTFLVNPCRILTDKTNYEPFETVTFFGSGFHPNSEVNMTLWLPDNSTTSWNVDANENGNFTTTYILEDNIGDYFVLANDSIYVASTWFTDPYVFIVPWPFYGGTIMDVIGSGFWGQVTVTLRDSADRYFFLGYAYPDSNGEFRLTTYAPYATPGMCTIIAHSSTTRPYTYCTAKCCDVCVFRIIVCLAWEYRCDADECGRDCSTRYEYRTFHYEGDFECLNIRPYIETGGPYEGYRGWPLQFDGSDSYDIDSPGEQIDEYEWDFGDGNTGSGARPTHTYEAAGTYEVMLTAWDRWGASHYDTTTVTIVEPPPEPVADASGPHTAFTRQIVVFDGSDSYDMDGTIVSYEWDFGDGNTRSGVNPTHSYSFAGTYTVTLTVTDNDGYSDVATTTITVEDPPNTGPGSGVVYTDPDTGVSVTFPYVYHSGLTVVTPTLSGPSPPSGRQAHIYYEITSTASYSGNPLISIPYDQSSLRYPLFESFLTLWFWDSYTNVWVHITYNVDTYNDIIYGYAPRLGLFAIMEIVDDTPPTTTPHLDGTEGNGGWYTSPVTISLSRTDDISGVAVTLCRFEGEVFSTYTGPIHIDTPGEYTLEFYSVDIAGNVEGIKHVDINIDWNAPETSIELEGVLGEHDWYVSDVTVTLTPTDTGPGPVETWYSLDDENWILYSVPFDIPITGEVNVSYYSIDQAGNVEDTKFEVFKIDDDVTPPTISIVYTGDGTDANPGVWTVAITDPESGIDSITVEINGVVVGTSAGDYPLSAELGTYEINVTAINADLDWGPFDQEQASAIDSITITDDDTSGPLAVITLTASPLMPYDHVHGNYYNRPVLTFTVPDMPITSCRMEITVHNGDSFLAGTRVTYFALDGIGGYIGCYYTPYSPYLFGDYVLGGFTQTYVYDMSQVLFPLPAPEYGYGHNYIPQSPSDTVGFLSPGEHTIESWVSSTESGSPRSWVTIKLYFNGQGVPTDQDSGVWTVTAEDQESGIESMTVEIDGFIVGDSPGDYPVPAQAGPHTIRVTATNADLDRGIVDQETTIVESTIMVYDMTAPDTILMIGGPYVNPYITSSTSLELSSDDGNGFGVETKYYKVNDGLWQVYDGSFHLTGNDGEYTLYYYAVDIVGNVESEHTRTFILDNSPPETTILPSGTVGNDDWFVSSVYLTLTADDGTGSGVASIYYVLDSGTLTLYTGTIEVSEDGYHTIEFWSEDYLGNIEATHLLYEFKIDTTPPDTKFDWSGYWHNGWYEPPVDALFRITEDGSGVALTEYSYDQITWHVYTGPFQIEMDGVHYIYFNSTDVAGNVEVTDYIYPIRIDGTPPECTIELDGTLGDNGWFVSDVLVNITLTDTWSGVEAVYIQLTGWDDWEVHEFSGSPKAEILFTLSEECENFRIRVFAGDIVGNNDEWDKRLSIDKTPPETTISFSEEPGDLTPIDGWFFGNIVVTLSATDDISPTIVTAYSYDMENWIEYVGPFLVTAEGEYTIYFNSTDEAGNVELTKYDVAKKDTEAPTVEYHYDGTLGLGGCYVSNGVLNVTVIDTASGLYHVDVVVTCGDWWAKSWHRTDGSHKVYSYYYYIPVDGVFIVNVFAGDILWDTTDDWAFIVDTTPPETTLSYVQIPGVGSVVTLTASDSTSGVESIMYSLNGVDWEVYNTPFTLSSGGIVDVYFYATDVAGHTENIKMEPVEVDVTPPVTTYELDGTLGLEGWYVSDVDVTLDATDDLMGVDVIAYSFDEVVWLEYTGVFTVSTEGLTRVYFNSTDVVGNMEVTQFIDIYIDKTAPITTLTIHPQSYGSNPTFVSTTTEFELTVAEVTSGIDRIEYSIDGGGWILYSSPFTVTEIGPHTIYYRSVDVAGNEESVQSVDIVVNASELTYTGELSGTYSDPVCLEALLIDVATEQPIAGKIIHFEVGGQTTSVTTNSTGYASVTIILDQPYGTYLVNASFDNDGEYLASFDFHDFKIERETAHVDYTGSSVVPTTVSTITIRATVLDDDDGTWGDLEKIYVTFRIYTMPLGGLTWYQTHGPYQIEATVIAGVGVIEIPITNLLEDCYTIRVYLDLEDNAYYQSAPSEDVIVTVYEPTGDFVTGGGWVWDSDGNRGNFGFNVKYKKNGLPKGQFVYIYRTGDYKFRIKATAWLGMAIIENHSFFEAKCVVEQYDAETDELIWSEGNYIVRVDVWDNEETEGLEDVFQIRVYDKQGLVYYDSGYDPYGFLQGGSIVIHTDKEK